MGWTRWFSIPNLEDGCRRVEIDDLYVAFCSSHYHQRVLNVHRVDAFSHVDGSYWIWGSEIPIL
jgi:hypothetical protein